MADAVIIVALLVFIVGWVALWALTWDTDDGKAVDGWVAFWVLVIIAGPPLWAGGLVKRVVGRG